MRDAGLVQVRPERLRRLHMVRPEGLESLIESLEAFLAELWPSLACSASSRPSSPPTMPDRGVPVRGRYLELDPPHRLLIS